MKTSRQKEWGVEKRPHTDAHKSTTVTNILFGEVPSDSGTIVLKPYSHRMDVPWSLIATEVHCTQTEGFIPRKQRACLERNDL